MSATTEDRMKLYRVVFGGRRSTRLTQDEAQETLEFLRAHGWYHESRIEPCPEGEWERLYEDRGGES